MPKIRFLRKKKTMPDIRCVKVCALETNCYIVSKPGSDRAVLIDPGAEEAKIRRVLDEAGLCVAGVLLTHGHFDHISAVDAFCLADRLPLYMHKYDVEQLTDGEKNASSTFGLAPVTVQSTPYPLDDGQTVTLAGLTFEIIHTPGHTRGSSCYVCEDCLFTGDTMFREGYGRSDLYGGSFSDMKRSIALLFPLRNKYRIFPGHG